MNHRRGFTLIELILTLGLVAMLGVALYMSLSAGYKARETTSATIAPVRTSLIAADLMRQDLETALPPTGILAGQFIGVQQGAAGASQDTCSFFCMAGDGPQSDGVMSEGIRKVELAVRTDVTPPVLVRRVTRNLLGTVQETPEEEILARGVKSFTLDYYDGTAWHNSWDSTTAGDRLPMAVEMTLEVEYERKPGEPPGVYHISRFIPIGCGRPSDPATSATGGS